MKVGDVFVATIKDAGGINKNSIGKIQIEEGKVYLCQNECSGASCRDKLGYMYSWSIGNIDVNHMRYYKEHMGKEGVTNFELADRS